MRQDCPAPFSWNGRSVRALRDRRYQVHLLDGLASSNSGALARALGDRRVLMVTTPTVAGLYGTELRQALAQHGVEAAMLVLPCTESSKDLGQVERVCTEAMRMGLDRRAVLMGVGGGVLTDIVTVAASWVRRGISTVRVPTTLIGQVDASIGIKGAVNFHGKKSYLGCFHAPEAVFVDPVFLSTLSQPQLRDGLAEIIKMALVRDARLFELAERHSAAFLASRFAEPPAEARETIWRSVDAMLGELEPNIYEDQSYMRLVDMGHTFSPSLEAVSGFTISHGRAVAIDTAFTCVIATSLGLFHPQMRDRVLDTLRAAHLPIFHPLLTVELCQQAVAEAARHRGGKLNLPVPTAIGEAVFVGAPTDLPVSLLADSLEWLERQAAAPAEAPVGAEPQSVAFA